MLITTTLQNLAMAMIGRKWVQGYKSGVLSLLCLGLLGCLIIQGTFLVIQWNHKQIELPNILLKKLSKYSNLDEFRFEFDEVTFGIGKGVSIKGVSAFYKKNPNPLVTCEYLRVKVNSLFLLFGHLSPSDVEIKNAVLYCPPSHSPTGLNEPVFKNFNTVLKQKGKVLEIKQFHLRLKNCAFNAQGYWQWKSEEILAFDMQKYFAAFRSFLEYQNTFKFFKNPELFLNTSLGTQEGMLLDAHFRSEGFEYPKKDVSIGGTQVRAQLYLKDDPAHSLSGFMYGVLGSVAWGDSFKTGKGVLHAECSSPLKAFSFPTLITGIFHEIEGLGHKADTLQCDLDLSDKSLGVATFSGVQDEQWIKGRVPIDIETWTLASKMKVEGRLNSEIWETLFPVISEKGKFPIHFEKAPFCRGEVTLNDDFTFESVALSVVSDNTRMRKLELSSLYADIEVTAKKISVSQAMLRGMDTEIKGSYDQKIGSQDYRFLLEGFTKPDRLDPWLGAWWPRLWLNYDLAYPLPRVNIDLRGNWVQGQQETLFAGVTAENFKYRNVPIENCSLKLHTNPYQVKLEDLSLKTKEGALAANYIIWDYETAKKDSLSRISLKGLSTLHAEDLASIVNNTYVSRALVPFKSSRGPQVSVEGFIHGEPKAQEDYFDIAFSTYNPFFYNKFPLDYIDFKAHFTPPVTVLNNVRMGFAKGNAQGSARLIKQFDENPELAFNMKLFSADESVASNHIKSLNNDSFVPNPLSRRGGLLDLEVAARGTPGNLSSFSGNGNITISQANFGKVNLFGLFLLPLPWGSFKLTDANTSFSMEKGVVHFPDMNIFGPTTNIKAHGDYFLNSHQLNFTLKIFPLTKIKVPLVSQAFTLLSPITQPFRVRLTGTIEKPEWDLELTPFGLFNR